MTDLDRPQFHEIDAWGLTHPGKVRTENQDHFFVGALARGIAVKATSVTESDQQVLLPERLASLGMVADGVGSTEGGAEAARLAVRELLNAVSLQFWAADVSEDDDPEVFVRLLNDAALSCHESLLERSEQQGGGMRFATTLTLFLGLWPHAYLLQVGDSRCYIYKDGTLTQISQDQTLAEELVANGTLTRSAAEQSRWANVLSSAIGGSEAAPVVTRVVRDWGTVVLLCSDGLTKHVPDEQIERRMASLTSARETAEALLQDALDGGGTDNISIVIGRTVKR
ncbi:MAG: protein phosphatase 2C domain-containing protein [Longimicrobiales bacterium]|nr:protein phosphatase 2C domain-containing protein [Longimicrobiales bacterium]